MEILFVVSFLAFLLVVLYYVNPAKSCTFRQCRWLHHFNVLDNRRKTEFGVYQCSNCKTISIGAPR